MEIPGLSVKNISVLIISFGLGISLAYKNPLEGRLAQCHNEGESVAVDHIDKYKCFTCLCKNGYVECQSDNCPRIEGCHMLAEKSNDGCCRKCKGCIYKGVHHESLTEWTDPDDPCKSIRCEAGVITESDTQCHTPCANPLAPEPGKCCPTCPECWINGQIPTPDRDVISDDPCLKCRCSGGRMICSKKACPVLQCPIFRQTHPPGECCPRCEGTRSLLTAPQTCILQSTLVKEGQYFNIDRCTNCSCFNETSICKRFACPVLDCSPELQKSIPGSCCKTCIMPEEVRSQCIVGGKLYEDGESWSMDACSSCKCQRGMPSCAMTRCNVTVPCAPGTRLVHLEGECCERCQEVDGVCMVFGDPHYKTFDGKLYTFQGKGKFQLVTDCVTHNFSVRVANEYTNRNTRNSMPIKSVPTSASTKRVTIRYGNIRINLQQRTRIKYNGKLIRLPLREDGVKIEKVQGNVEVTLGNGVKVFWTGKSFLEVSVPPKFKNKLCGLCGNFNSNVQDDLKMRRWKVVKENEINLFGYSWSIGPKTTIPKTPKISTTCNLPRAEQNYCKYLMDTNIFGACNSKINYNKYYRICKMDMCNCGDEKCYCESVRAYARECQRLGVELPNWQKHTLCSGGALRKPKVSRKSGPYTTMFSQEDLARTLRRRNLTREPIPLLND